MALPILSPAGYVLGTRENTRCQKGNVGWDVKALQRALVALDHDLPRFGADGHYGDETVAAVGSYQREKKLEADGWAGPVTMRAAALELWWPVQDSYAMPPGLGRGQLGHESGLLFGNHSPARQQSRDMPNDPDENGNYFDNGIAQMASEYHSYETAYDPAEALCFYAKTITDYYKKYKRVGKITDERRLWELAAGAWNRPAHANWLAGIRDTTAVKPTDAQITWLEGYISRTTHLLVIR